MLVSKFKEKVFVNIREFYEKAQRMIWAETGLVKKLKKGEYDLELLKLAVKAPWYRLGAYRLARATA